MLRRLDFECKSRNGKTQNPEPLAFGRNPISPSFLHVLYTAAYIQVESRRIVEFLANGQMANQARIDSDNMRKRKKVLALLDVRCSGTAQAIAYRHVELKPVQDKIPEFRHDG